MKEIKFTVCRFLSISIALVVLTLFSVNQADKILFLQITGFDIVFLFFGLLITVFLKRFLFSFPSNSSGSWRTFAYALRAPLFVSGFFFLFWNLPIIVFSNDNWGEAVLACLSISVSCFFCYGCLGLLKKKIPKDQSL